jgi:hypothetical protein
VVPEHSSSSPFNCCFEETLIFRLQPAFGTLPAPPLPPIIKDFYHHGFALSEASNSTQCHRVISMMMMMGGSDASGGEEEEEAELGT